MSNGSSALIKNVNMLTILTSTAESSHQSIRMSSKTGALQEFVIKHGVLAEGKDRESSWTDFEESVQSKSGRI